MVNQCLFKEAGQLQSRLRFAFRVLQFLPDTQELAGNTGDGSGPDRSHRNGRKASHQDTVLVKVQGSCYRDVTVLTLVTQDP